MNLTAVCPVAVGSFMSTVARHPVGPHPMTAYPMTAYPVAAHPAAMHPAAMHPVVVGGTAVQRPGRGLRRDSGSCRGDENQKREDHAQRAGGHEVTPCRDLAGRIVEQSDRRAQRWRGPPPLVDHRPKVDRHETRFPDRALLLTLARLPVRPWSVIQVSRK